MSIFKRNADYQSQKRVKKPKLKKFFLKIKTLLEKIMGLVFNQTRYQVDNEQEQGQI